MRVLHMIPDIGISNGVMSVILNYAKAMPEDIIFDVVYFAEKEKTRKADIEALGGRVYKISPPSPKDLLTGKMNHFFAQHKNEWQALHIHCPHFAVLIAPYAKKAGIKKIAVHCHTTEFSLKGNGKRNKLLSLYAKYFIHTKFACGRTAGDLWYGNKKYTVLNNAIDCGKYVYDPKVRQSVRNRMGLDGRFVVGHIGRSDVSQKNHPFLLQIFSEIKKKNSNARLLLIGAAPTDKLICLCGELNIRDCVSFLGIRDDVADILQACDIFVFPSTSEGLPVSVIEAQAAGLPVIMSDTVTDEVIATDLVEMKSLTDSAESWAEACLNCNSSARSYTFDVLKKAGWNTAECAEELASYYKNDQ